MKTYSNKISLVRNSRGVYCLDTTIGCASGMQNDGGCYGDCYAAKSAKLYGYDFTKTVLRKFVNRQHEREIVNQINKIKLDFVRIGCSGDPSEDWEHTISVLKIISKCNKEIIIITRHWTTLTEDQLRYLSTINVCVNTSASALDQPQVLLKSLYQFNRLKPYCKSILRVVSCDFNRDNEIGENLFHIQEKLFKNDGVIDTVFRPSKNSGFIVEGIINTKTEVFNGHKTLASKYKRKTYMGKCGNCHEMCGANMKKDFKYPRPLTKQLAIFK